jgi:enoyl-CoA hydratase
MNYENLIVRYEGVLAWVTINRPKALNALNQATIDELDHCFTELADNKDVRGVILKGGGEKAFVAGAGITEFQGLDAAGGTELSRKGQAVFDRIERLDKPVLAMIQGFALGGGCELAMACHLRIASEKAIFGQPEVKLGLIPGFGGTQRLVQLIGKTHAMEWLMSGGMYSADDAMSLGLVNRIVPKESLEEESKKFLLEILKMAPVAVGQIISTMNAFYNPDEDGYLVERQRFGKLCETSDFVEGVKAFLEKRDPDFNGK